MDGTPVTDLLTLRAMEAQGGHFVYRMALSSPSVICAACIIKYAWSMQNKGILWVGWRPGPPSEECYVCHDMRRAGL